MLATLLKARSTCPLSQSARRAFHMHVDVAGVRQAIEAEDGGRRPP